MSWSKRLPDPSDGDFFSWKNPFNFFLLLAQNDSTLYQWLQNHNLIATRMICELCTKPCVLIDNKKKKGGKVWRCRGSLTWRHEKTYSLHKNSFFERSHFDVREILVFVREWILKSSLRRCSAASGMDYKRTSVDWANFLRDICRKFVHDLYYVEGELLSGEIEIDESLFGRRCKYNRGGARGMKVWIFGMVERSTNKIILYPVENRNQETLLPLIERHVAKGSTIYSDGWRAYGKLNEKGYSHFTVEHRHTFVQEYKNVETGEIKEVHTNTIEGAWKHAKNHFRMMNGTKINNFEGHLCEIIWRNRASIAHHDMIVSFMSLVTKYYDLAHQPNLEIRSPLFDSWTANNKVDRVHRDDDEMCSKCDEGVQTVEPTPQAEQVVANMSTSASDEEPSTSGMGRYEVQVTPDQPTTSHQQATTSSTKPTATESSSPYLVGDDDAEFPGRAPSSVKKDKKGKKTLSTKTGTLCHPANYAPIDRRGKEIKKKKGAIPKANPYTKQNFVIPDPEWSDDSDFET